MKYFIRKVWISAFLGILIVVTACTSTYAWYAMNYVNDIDNFDFNINGSSSIFISNDGINFKAGLESIEVKRSILKNKNYSVDDMTNFQVEEEFKKLVLAPATPNDYHNLSNGFSFISNQESGSSFKYFNFDIYLSTDNEISQSIYYDTSQVISAENKRVNLGEFGIKNHPTLGSLEQRIRVNVSNTIRIGVAKSEVVPVGYTSNLDTNNDIIYTIGKEEASINDGVYNFGGINAKPNIALEYFNHMTNQDLKIPENDRQDILFDGNQAVSVDEGLTKGKMIKLSIYVWLEGWDADCFDIFRSSSFNFSLAFSTYKNS